MFPSLWNKKELGLQGGVEAAPLVAATVVSPAEKRKLALAPQESLFSIWNQWGVLSGCPLRTG